MSLHLTASKKMYLIAVCVLLSQTAYPGQTISRPSDQITITEVLTIIGFVTVAPALIHFFERFYDHYQRIHRRAQAHEEHLKTDCGRDQLRNLLREREELQERLAEMTRISKKRQEEITESTQELRQAHSELHQARQMIAQMPAQSAATSSDATPPTNVLSELDRIKALYKQDGFVLDALRRKPALHTSTDMPSCGKALR